MIRATRSTLLFFFFLFVSFLIMVFHVTSAIRSLRSLLFYCLAPSTQMIASIHEEGHNFANQVMDLIHTNQDNRLLKEKIRDDALIHSSWLETSQENVRLRKLLDLKSRIPFRTVPALVVVREAQNWTQSVLIDRGSQEGVQPQSPVLALGRDQEFPPVFGVVGRVLECSAHTSQVLLLTDPLSSVSVVLPRTREQGLVQGSGSRSLTIEYVDQSAELQVGEPVSTSGMGGIFPAGISVGIIEELIQAPSEFKRAKVRPTVPPSQIREVLVLIQPQEKMHD